MSVIVIQKSRSPSGGYGVPSGGGILWYGVASAIPEGWSIDTALSGYFLEIAAAGEASDTPSGSATHNHTNAATSAVADHAHDYTSWSTTSYTQTELAHTASGASTVAVSNHNHSGTAGTTLSAGGHSHTVPNTQNADNLPPYKRYYWIVCSGEQEVPVGGIIMWDGLQSTFPANFYLCDGNAHDSLTTPDLRSKFIYAAGADAQVGNSGGSTVHTHEMQSVDAAGGHSHTASGNTGYANTRNGGYEGNYVLGEHRHGWTGSTETDSSHIHSFATATGEATSLPPAKGIYFIMRTV